MSIFTITNTAAKDKDVEIIKVDSVTGTGLAGARLQILNAAGDVVDEWTSDGSVHTAEQLPLDANYTLHEVSAPDGYYVRADIRFKIDASENIHMIYSGEPEEDTVNIIIVMNYRKAILPETGSFSAIAISAAGIIICLGGVAFIMKQNKKHEEE